MPEPPPARGSAAPTPAGEAQGVLEGGTHDGDDKPDVWVKGQTAPPWVTPSTPQLTGGTVVGFGAGAAPRGVFEGQRRGDLLAVGPAGHGARGYQDALVGLVGDVHPHAAPAGLGAGGRGAGGQRRRALEGALEGAHLGADTRLQGCPAATRPPPGSASDPPSPLTGDVGCPVPSPHHPAGTFSSSSSSLS